MGNEWEPVNCEEYPDDPMCAGKGDFFHEFIYNAAGLALDRNDMFDIYGGPQELAGPPAEFCQENLGYRMWRYRPADVFRRDIAPGY